MSVKKSRNAILLSTLEGKQKKNISYDNLKNQYRSTRNHVGYMESTFKGNKLLQRKTEEQSNDAILSQGKCKASTRESSVKSLYRSDLDWKKHLKMNCLINTYSTHYIHLMHKGPTYKKNVMPRGTRLHRNNFKIKERSLEQVNTNKAQMIIRPSAHMFFPQKLTSSSFSCKTQFKSEQINTIQLQKQSNSSLLKICNRVKEVIREYKESENSLIKENNNLKQEIVKLRNLLKHQT